jgi:hypothetical protein
MKFTSNADFLGMGAAALCMVHCMAFPLLVVLGGPIWEQFHHEWHYADYAFLSIGLIALVYSLKHSSSKLVKAALIASYLLLSVTLIFQHELPFGHNAVYVASALLIVSHFYNWRHQRACKIAA